MLNEVYELSQSMKAAGIAIESWDKDYGTLPKKSKTFKVLLGDNGRITDLEPINDIEKIMNLRKWEVANGTSFPAFNVMPLLQAKTEKATEQVKSLKKALQSDSSMSAQDVSSKISALCDTCDGLWSGSEAERINRCVKDHPAQLQNILRDVPHQDFRAIKELIRRAALLDADMLQKELRRIIEQHLFESPKSAKGWMDTLLVSTAKTAKKVCLVLELSDWSALFNYPANHEKVQKWINSRLMSTRVPSNSTFSEFKEDAFGYPLNEADSQVKFPDIKNLGKLVNVKLRAMSSQIPCQTRYGRLDSYSFPASQTVRQTMKDSMEWLSKPERKGKTWEDITGACGFTRGQGKKVPIPGILLAYPSLLPVDPPELAQLFAGRGDTSNSAGTKFEKCAERVVSALNLVVDKNLETDIKVFVLAKADEARTKLLLSRRYDADQVVTAAQGWLAGCKNIPTIIPNIGTKEEPHWVAPYVPFPTEVVRCLNIAWLQGGTRTNAVHGLSMGEGIALFMEKGDSESGTINRGLYQALSNGGALLLALGHADHRCDGSFKVNSYANHANLLPSLLGLFLYKLNIAKGGYMRSAPFLIGQILGLADTLHREYCQHIRKGQVPPQLIGNAIMAVALENPIAGLARLSERIAPYQAWANTASGEGVGLAKWTLQQFGRVAQELGEQVIPVNCSDADKAQILMGYLARSDVSSNHS